MENGDGMVFLPWAWLWVLERTDRVRSETLEREGENTLTVQLTYCTVRGRSLLFLGLASALFRLFGNVIVYRAVA